MRPHHARADIVLPTIEGPLTPPRDSPIDDCKSPPPENDEDDVIFVSSKFINPLLPPTPVKEERVVEVIEIPDEPEITSQPQIAAQPQTAVQPRIAEQSRGHRRRRRRDSNDSDDNDAGQPSRRRRRRHHSPESVDEIIIVEKEVDRTFLYDPFDVERPPPSACLPWMAKDANGEYPPTRDWSKIDNTIDKPVISDLVFPDVFNDEPEYVTRELEVTRKRREPRTRRRNNASRRRRVSPPPPPSDDGDDSDGSHHNGHDAGIPGGLRDEEIADSDVEEVVLTPLDPAHLQIKHGCRLFSRLNSDIRMIIYRYVLVASEPVVVHTNWTMVYQRQRPSIAIQFVETCKAIYNEATSVLYGQNTFRYRIRDAGNTLAAITSLHHPAFLAGNHGDDDGDDEDSGSD
ncbi:hypothetical protein LIA77_01090 [Sarocladium implicatum]|nr:hypothetical protein LIA77_01090 [Sarocladium implicatum]